MSDLRKLLQPGGALAATFDRPQPGRDQEAAAAREALLSLSVEQLEQVLDVATKGAADHDERISIVCRLGLHAIVQIIEDRVADLRDQDQEDAT